MAPTTQTSKNSKKNSTTELPEIMIVNDVPGEECRIAILQDGHLGELYSERQSTATDVGSIYKGKVVNVEPAIQAAFIDYGQGVNGFLHISDLHPRYFPGEERTERVGKKIPRRDRPSIQQALRRGQEILVQVLKEGIGTKGPTLTSYLSIPGRLLVMMPDMDRVGVSRKVEDEEKRREMRAILDSLNLPEGFGFILRTAGFGKTKTELKRDAAYLMRLWKVMEKRIKSAGAPCELYTESDLLIRTIRDVLRPSINAIVVDSESAFERVNMFLGVVAPRSAPKVLHYRRSAPIFHAFDIERQIELIHAREVPLPSGGRLVIDQTEALVAIDVNSGRSRSARDSETNAYETNVEATDEICRQLRLRDLGGLIVNDLIDMRSAKHRKAIEERFINNFKRDRARTTIAPISEFGILEMTRQRMRPSLRKAHFMSCPHCNGRGEIRSPESVASDAVRHVGYLLQYERIRRVELACSPRVASVLLSTKRRELVRMEDESEKRVDVRVSEAIAADRVDYYAYDERNADIDLTRLPPLQKPTIEELEREQSEPAPAQESEDRDEGSDETHRRRRRRGRRGPADATAIALAGNFDEELEALGYDETEDDVVAGEPSPPAPAISANGQPQVDAEGGARKRRRRRRRRRGGSSGTAAAHIADTSAQSASTHAPVVQATDQHQNEGGTVRVHELAKELNVTTAELIERVEPEPAVHSVTSPLSSVSAEEADVIRHMFAGDAVLAEQPLQSEPDTGSSAGHASATSQVAVGRKKRRRRRGRRGAGQQGQPTELASTPATPSVSMQTQQHTTEPSSEQIAASSTATPAMEQSSVRKRRRRRRGRSSGQHAPSHQGTPSIMTNQSSREPHPQNHTASPAATKTEQTQQGTPSSSPQANTGTKKPRRALYRAGRGTVSARAREGAGGDDE